MSALTYESPVQYWTRSWLSYMKMYLDDGIRFTYWAKIGLDGKVKEDITSNSDPLMICFTL